VENAVENAGSSGTILSLNHVQDRYGYYLVFIPKILLNLYGSVFSRTQKLFYFEDVYNDVVVWGQSFLFLYVFPESLFVSSRTRDNIARKLLFSFLISCIVFAYIPVVQNRYFYSSYILLIAIMSMKRSVSLFDIKRIKILY